MHNEDKAFYGHGMPYLKTRGLRGSETLAAITRTAAPRAAASSASAKPIRPLERLPT